jgi:hypothetical protein
MSIRPTSFGVGEAWTWNIRLRNLANAAVDADSTPTVTVYKNNSATGESVTVTKPSATTGWYQCSFDPAGEAEHDVYSFVENVTIASVAQAPFQWEAVVLASVGAGGLDAAGVRAAVGLASANMDTQLSGINNKTTNLPSDPADQSAVDGLIVAAVAAIRGADNDTLKTLSDQIDVVGSGTGTGARTVVVTVNDGATALQNAAVRLTEGANSFKGLTNVSGVVTFNVDDATYTVGITKGGYSYAGTTLVVDGAEAVTYIMTANTIPEPSTPDKTVLTILCLNSTGDAASGVPISIRYAAIPVDSENIAFPGGTITGASNGSGVASFEVIKGATIEYKRGTRDVWLEAVMSDEDTTSITSFIGMP